MTEIDRYKKLKLELEDIAGKLVGLPQRVDALKAESRDARDAAVRMELLGDPGAAGKRAGIRAAQDEVRKIEADREDLLHRREILKSVMEETRSKAKLELEALHRPVFAKAVKAFVAALRAAHKAELDVVALREEIDRDYVQGIDARSTEEPFPEWQGILLQSRSSSSPMRSEVAAALERLKGQGFDLS
jgi:hypothetical protein